MTGPSGSREKPPKMLIADDDPSVLRLLADRCAAVGFEVKTATDGIQTLIKTIQSQPDIIIVDVNMPEADGLSVCAQLLDPSKRSLNAVVVTGSRKPGPLEQCEEMGVYYVRKGPEFWRGLRSALTELFPGMADRLSKLHQQPSAAESRERPRVLVIDEDFATRQFLASRLDKSGADLLFASEIGQAFRMACRERPSTIISDYSCPNGGVPHLLSRLRTTPATERIPVLVLTERALGETVESGLMRDAGGKSGATRVLRKSFDTSELFEALQELSGFEHPPADR